MNLSLCESELPPPSSVGTACSVALPTCHRYPDDGHLRRSLADFHGVSEDKVIPGAGSIEVLAAGINSLELGLAFSVPGFSMYSRLAAGRRIQSRPVPLSDMQEALPSLTAASWRSDVDGVIICDPHSPTGTQLEPDALLDYLGRMDPTCLVIVDQAYAEFSSTAPSPARLLECHPRILVTRTFSKARGLAGLRVGFGMCTGLVRRQIAGLMMPFSVSRVSCEAACASLRTPEHLAAVVAAGARSRADLAGCLAEVGIASLPSVTNFCFVPARPPGGIRLGDQLARLGIDVAVWPEGVRVTASRHETNARVARLLAEVMASARPARSLSVVEATP